jgi:NAD(P)-dependent dehydrogenase (short-subunit alcohol dehydrogenase family)
VSNERNVAVTTGASQGMCAALVTVYRDRDYGVVATARSIRPTNDQQILFCLATLPTARRPSARHRSFCFAMAAHTRNASTTARKPADMFFRLG